MDDITPTVWEEADGAGLSAGINKVTGTSAGGTIEFTPELATDGLTARIAYSPDADGSSTVGDKATGGTSGVLTSSVNFFSSFLTSEEPIYSKSSFVISDFCSFSVNASKPCSLNILFPK